MIVKFTIVQGQWPLRFKYLPDDSIHS